MESKDEASDSDSGVILQSGSDSPQSLMKDLHCSVISRQHMLEETLEAYLKELKKLCLREAELTGKLPKEYPLAEGEEPPTVRRRIGTAFKLDETIMPEGEDSELSSLEREFALQLQFVEAARRLSQEDNLTRQIRKQRKNIFSKEQKKLKNIQQALEEYGIKGIGKPLQLNNVLEELSASDDSSLSDAAVLDEADDVHLQGPHASVECLPPVQPPQNWGSPVSSPFKPLPPQHLEGIAQHRYQKNDYDRSPIANKAWKESSLDEPYEKEKRSSSSSSKSSSPSVTPSESLLGDIPTFAHYSMRSFPHQSHNSSSAPPTPDLRGRTYYQTRYVDVNQLQAPPEQRGRSLLPQRRHPSYTVFAPDCYSTGNRPMDSPQFVACSVSGYASSESHSPGISTPSYAPAPHDYDRGAPRYWQMYNSPAGPGRYVTQYRDDDGFYHCDSSPPFQYYRAVEHPDANAMAHVWGHGPKPHYVAPQQPQHPVYRECHYGDENASLKVQRITPSHCRIVRTPSLKEYPNRGLIREVVSEELKSWHERSRRRNGRPHSLDRRDAIRIPHSQSRGREHYVHWPVRPAQRHLSHKAPEPRLLYMTEESEVASQF